jgi:hypothetical protein
MALTDIVYPEQGGISDGFILEIVQGSLGTVIDIVFAESEIVELTLAPGAGGETSWVF